MSKITMDGKPVGDITKFTLDFESYDLNSFGKPGITLGRHDVSGTIVCYFDDPELLAEYCRRDVEYTAAMRDLLVSSERYDRRLRWLKLTAKVAFVAALLLYATGYA